MELQQLTAFLVVAEELHFGRAAERLHIAQPPLSRTIQQLERDLGQRLFDRTTRSVRLTSAGEALLGPARDILDGCRVARRAVLSAGQGETGRVRLGFAGPSTFLMVGELGRLVHHRHPGIELSLESTTYGHRAIRAVLAGELDLVIARWFRDPLGLTFRPVMEERHVIVVPEAHRFGGREEVSIAELREEEYVMLPADPGGNVRDSFLRTCADAGFAPTIVQTAPDSFTVMALVAAGAGITFTVDSVLAAVAGSIRQRIHVIPLVEGRKPTYAYLGWREGDDSPALREVLRAAEEALPVPASWPPD